jgi:hypothetical protein
MEFVCLFFVLMSVMQITGLPLRSSGPLSLVSITGGYLEEIIATPVKKTANTEYGRGEPLR